MLCSMTSLDIAMEITDEMYSVQHLIIMDNEDGTKLPTPTAKGKKSHSIHQLIKRGIKSKDPVIPLALSKSLTKKST